MATLVLKTPDAIINPGDSPILPDLDSDILWELKSSELQLSNNDPVDIWSQSRGSLGLTLSPSGLPAPIYRSATPSVYFGGSAVLRDSAPLVSSFGITVAALFRVNSLGLNHTILSSSGSNDNYVYFRVLKSGTMRFSTSTQVRDGAPVAPGEWVFACGVFNGGASEISVNDNILETSFPTDETWRGVSLGASAANINTLSGDIANAVTFDRPLARSEVQALRQMWLSELGLSN